MKRTTVFAALMLLSVQAWAGIVYSVSTRTTQENTDAVMRVRTKVEGEFARIELLEGAVGPLHAGTYMLTRDGGKTIYFVDPGNKTYGLLDRTAMLGESGARVAEAVKVTTTAPKLEKVVDERGPKVLGLETRHGKFKTSYSITVKLLEAYTSAIVSEDEVWWTDKLNDGAVTKWSLQDVMPQDPAGDALMSVERSKHVGFPLKRTIVTRAEETDGRETVVQTTMEVTDLNVTTIPDTEFEIPKGFEKVSRF